MRFYTTITILIFICLSTAYSQEILSPKEIHLNSKKVRRNVLKFYNKHKNIDTSTHMLIIYISKDIEDLSYSLIFSMEDLRRVFEIKEGKDVREVNIKEYLRQYGYYTRIKNKIIYLIDYNELVDKSGLVMHSTAPFIDIECSKIKKKSWSGY